MSKVLVTGGCGFIGSRIVRKLLKMGYDVHIVDNLSTGSVSNIDINNVSLHKLSIQDNGVEEVFKNHKFKFIIHQAAQTSVPYSIENITVDTDINIMGSVYLIDLAKRYKVGRFIFASSAAIYGNPKALPIEETYPGNPTSPYGLAKFTVEKYLKLAYEIYGLKYTILRYSNVFGPKQTSLGEGGVVSIFDQCFRRNERPVIFGDGYQTRDFIFVDDVAEANVASLDVVNNGVYNISSNKQTTINELLYNFNKLYGVELQPNHVENREGDIRDSILSNELALKELNWMTRTSLEEGLKETVLTESM
ncbi:NAD-dependent epimerase/dehydratase family protein [Virgibacillus ndiopensis]|uniref:NAD-dependent epimerase/dehydratase family protein n=1 Tax=Virgibacillus ndiopensis TaxID=2004408 RepID=UPI000C0852FE|nr:NAD-dependent epimerase/dehydratase family protein [Virgibacillus ndiopensis]